LMILSQGMYIHGVSPLAAHPQQPAHRPVHHRLFQPTAPAAVFRAVSSPLQTPLSILRSLSPKPLSSSAPTRKDSLNIERLTG